MNEASGTSSIQTFSAREGRAGTKIHKKNRKHAVGGERGGGRPSGFMIVATMRSALDRADIPGNARLFL